MRSPSEPESNITFEHVHLDLVESPNFKGDELRFRTELLEMSEAHMREGLYPALYPRRRRNMEALFELLRHSNNADTMDLWLEARLLRLTERYDACRQLRQSRPMYEWLFSTLQEFVWAGRADSFPYPRRSPFTHDQDTTTASQLYVAAKTLHDAKCYQWQQAYDEEAQPTSRESRLSLITGVGLFVILLAAIVAWNLYSGWIALLVFVVGAMIWCNLFEDGDDLKKKRMRIWSKENPKPAPMKLELGHRYLVPGGGGFPDI
jgi:hypothetical protein